MLRSILIPLDASQASHSALQIAVEFSKEQLQKITGEQRPVFFTGVAVVDRSGITRQPTPAGAGAIKLERDEALLADAKAKTQQALDTFEQSCRAEDIPYETVRCEGSPEEEIERLSRRHDLIVIGKDTNFHFETSDRRGDTVRWLLHKNPRPLILAPEKMPSGDCTIIAYDGSMKSAHAMQMWTLLDRRKNRKQVYVVSVDRNKGRATELCEEAATFLKYHDVDAQQVPVETSGNASEAVMEAVEHLDPRLLVMGAFGQGGLKSMLFGSVTKRLIASCPYPLFVCQ